MVFYLAVNFLLYIIELTIKSWDAGMPSESKSNGPERRNMVKEMREAGMLPIKPVLALRSKAERLGKKLIDPAKESQAMPPHLRSRRTPRIRSVVVIPDAASAGPSNPPMPDTHEPTMQIQMATGTPDIPPSVENAVTPEFNEEMYGEDIGLPQYTIKDAERMICDEDDMTLDDASDIHETALVKYVPSDQTFSEAFITDAWEGWMPQFFPLYEGPSLPLSDLPTDIIMGTKGKLQPKDQAKFLTAVGSVARRPEVKEALFQLKRVQRRLFHLMGEWAYYIRWIQPRELARDTPIRQYRIDCAYRHYVRFNRDTRAERMAINDIARVWGVYGTELREEIDWQEGGDNDSSDDDIMQK